MLNLNLNLIIYSRRRKVPNLGTCLYSCRCRILLHRCCTEDPQHAVLKHARAAIAAFFQLIAADAVSLAETADVKALAKNCRIVAPLRAKYSTRFSVQLFFDLFLQWHDSGLRNESMPLMDLRRKSVVLGRVATGCRSDGCAKIRRAWNNERHSGLLGSLDDLRAWRYYRPKNVRSLAGDMSKWTSLRPRVPFEDTRMRESCCALSAISEYVRRTDGLPIALTKEGDRPLFLSSIPRAARLSGDKQFFGIGRDTVAKDALAIMEKSSVDISIYKAHSARHAAVNSKMDRGVSQDDALSDAKMSGKVFTKHYQVPLDTTNAELEQQRLQSGKLVGAKGKPEPAEESGSLDTLQ
eukprot:SAG31_NODE_2903_length_4928_cov_6.524746_1_plen_352_part_00